MKRTFTGVWRTIGSQSVIPIDGAWLLFMLHVVASTFTMYVIGLITFGMQCYLILEPHERFSSLTHAPRHYVAYVGGLSLALAVLSGVLMPVFYVAIPAGKRVFAFASARFFKWWGFGFLISTLAAAAARGQGSELNFVNLLDRCWDIGIPANIAFLVLCAFRRTLRREAGRLNKPNTGLPTLVRGSRLRDER